MTDGNQRQLLINVLDSGNAHTELSGPKHVCEHSSLVLTRNEGVLIIYTTKLYTLA